ncbi:MAG: MBL fold metallo-hydrolase [Opitutales bacterium]
MSAGGSAPCTAPDDPIRLTDLNRDGGIGANALLLEWGNCRLLIDAGIHPKRLGLEAVPDFRQIADGPLDAIILTHCHLDHLGALPIAAAKFPEAQLLTSRSNALIAPRMLRNSVNVMRRQREETGNPDLPLYSRSMVDAVENRMIGLPYNRPFAVEADGDPVELTFHGAGHVAGAAGLSIQRGHRRALITGDVLFTEQATLPGAALPTHPVDLLVMETTRGGTARKPGRDREAEIERFLTVANDTLTAGGSVLVPVFALGRMQEMLTILHQASREGRFPDVPFYCSGLGMDLVNYLDAATRRHGDVRFSRKVIKGLGVQKPDWNLKPGQRPPTGFYLLSSGMLVENTPSYRFAAAMIDQPDNALLFVGYCDPDTPGGRLLANAEADTFLFETLDQDVPIRAHIEQFDMSGHADRDELAAFALSLHPKTIVLTHGDPEARAWFRKEFADTGHPIQVIDPEPLKAIDL